jgi:hypothetical protein
MLSAVIPEPPDNPVHPHIRGIFEQERLAEILSGLGISSLKVDSVLEGFANTVCRKPELFAREPSTGWSRVVVKAFPPDIPSMRIWFTYDEDNIYFEHVELIEE